MIKNYYKVNKKQWQEWPEKSKNIFNSLYEISLNNACLFQHPNYPILEEGWKTVAWNHAWMAAEISIEGIECQ